MSRKADAVFKEEYILLSQMAVNLGLGWLCILFVLLSINTVVCSYCVALSYGHIFPFLPAISETGVLYPERYIFRELGNLTGFLFVANAYVRFLQYQLVAEQCPERHSRLDRLNLVAFVTAMFSGTGITFVVNFEVQKVRYVASFCGLPAWIAYVSPPRCRLM